MRDYGKISTSIWESKKFTGLSSDNFRMFYLYLHTCPHVNSIGCFRLKIGYITADLGWSAKDADRAIEALCKAHLVRWDADEQIVLISNFLTESPITNIKHGVGAVKLALALPECPLKHKVMAELIADKYAGKVTELEAYDRPMDTPMHTTETEPETERETEPETETEPDGTSVPSVNDNLTVMDSFDFFWEQFPRKRRGNKAKAKSAYARAIKEFRATDGDILEGLMNYVKSAEVANGYAKGAEAWLNDDRWGNDYAAPTNQGGGQSNEIRDAFDRAAQKLRDEGQ